MGLTDERFQLGENAPDFKNSIPHEGVKQVHTRLLVPSEPGYLDEYLNGSGGVENWGNGAEGVRDYCIVLKKTGSICQQSINLNGRRKTAYGCGDNKVLSSPNKKDKLTVLISVFESADDSECDIVGKLPELVRLQRYDECPSLRVQALNGGLTMFPSAGVFDHELSIFSLGEDVTGQDWETRIIPVLFGQAADKDIIQCTSQVMYEVSEHEGNHGIRLLSNAETTPDFILAVRGPDASETVRIAAGVPHGFLLDIYHVLLCAPEFEPPIILHDMLYSLKEASDAERQANTEDTERLRDTCSSKGRGSRCPKEGGKAHQALNSQPPPEEVESQTAREHRHGGCISKHTRLGSLEDA